jgi:predicted ATPase
MIPRDMDVYLLTGAADVGHSGLIRELERAGNTVTVVRIPITDLN